MSGEVTLGPLELLAVAALPLSAISGALKRYVQRRFGGSFESSENEDGS
ncbi:hypothetical protein [Salinigranum sp. GCM10025319]